MLLSSFQADKSHIGANVLNPKKANKKTDLEIVDIDIYIMA